eukprot:6542101-Prymnesium_polylepis.1
MSCDSSSSQQASERASSSRRESWAQAGVGRLEHAKKKLEAATGVSIDMSGMARPPPPPSLERRQSSRLKNRAAAAPYPQRGGDSSDAPSQGDTGTGITPLMNAGMDL